MCVVRKTFKSTILSIAVSTWKPVVPWTMVPTLFPTERKTIEILQLHAILFICTSHERFSKFTIVGKWFSHGSNSMTKSSVMVINRWLNLHSERIDTSSHLNSSIHPFIRARWVLFKILHPLCSISHRYTRQIIINNIEVIKHWIHLIEFISKWCPIQLISCLEREHSPALAPSSHTHKHAHNGLHLNSACETTLFGVC